MYAVIKTGGKQEKVEAGQILNVEKLGKAFVEEISLTPVLLVDGDTVLEPDAVAHLLVPFADPRVGAVSGNAKVGNRRGLLGRWQHIEYVIGFNLDRRLYDTLGCMPTVPGALGAFRRRGRH